MCTLTIIRAANGNAIDAAGLAAGTRVVCNRDESRLRPPALPPQLRTFGDRKAWLPIDPVSDGTWIAASDTGLVFVLMNVHVDRPPSSHYQIATAPGTPVVSRGRIIPHALPAANLSEARAIVEAMDTRVFDPFRIIVADRTQLFEFVWARGERRSHPLRPIEEPLFFTSSGLGDEVVATPRRELFDECFAAPAPWQASQDLFHAHSWPGNERASVWMTRADALTVSRTEVEITEDRVTMNYHARLGDSARVVDAGPAILHVATDQRD